MRLIGLDTETHLILPGLLAPRMVCLTAAELIGWDGDKPKVKRSIFLREDAIAWIRENAKDHDALFILAFAAFDSAVLAETAPDLLRLIFQLYEEGRISDIIIREKLWLLSQGRLRFDFVRGRPPELSLAGIVKTRFGVDLSADKKDPKAWRLRYKELDGVPLSRWPVKAVNYAMEDADWALLIFIDQCNDLAGIDYLDPDCGQTDEDGFPVRCVDEIRACRADFALNLMSCWGLRTDPAAVEAVKLPLQEKVDGLIRELLKEGLVRENVKKGITEYTKNTKIIRDRIENAYRTKKLEELRTTYPEGTTFDLHPSSVDPARVGFLCSNEGHGIHVWEPDGVPWTAPSGKFPSGQIKMDEETLSNSGDPILELMGEHASDEKLLGTFIPVLERGTVAPIQCRWNSLLETGRTATSGPNIQQPPRFGGIRECYVPREGFLYLDIDLDTAECRAWAQTCLDLFGWSKMAEALRAGKDPHLVLAAEILSISYDEALRLKKARDPELKNARQYAKIGNFGFMGGMGEESFIEYAKGYGITLTLAEAHRIREAWLATWPESKPYFKWVNNQLAGGADGFTYVSPGSGRRRGGVGYCDGCNMGFQPRIADASKEATWELAKQCYIVDDSPLYGSRPVMFIHDQWVIEVPEDIAPEAAARAEAVILEVMPRWIPDIPHGASPALTRRFMKGPETVYGPDGRLTIYEPEPELKAA